MTTRSINPMTSGSPNHTIFEIEFLPGISIDRIFHLIGKYDHLGVESWNRSKYIISGPADSINSLAQEPEVKSYQEIDPIVWKPPTRIEPDPQSGHTAFTVRFSQEVPITRIIELSNRHSLSIQGMTMKNYVITGPINSLIKLTLEPEVALYEAINQQASIPVPARQAWRAENSTSTNGLEH